jgi:hypothetical protein
LYAYAELELSTGSCVGNCVVPLSGDHSEEVMATPGGQAQAAVAAPPGQAAPRTDMAPVLQQLNLASLRTRTQDLHNAISRILHSFHTLPALKWLGFLTLVSPLPSLCSLDHVMVLILKSHKCGACRSEVLGQFAMVNVELLNLVEDIKPILKMFVVYPKNVNAENATSNFTAALYFQKKASGGLDVSFIIVYQTVDFHLRLDLWAKLVRFIFNNSWQCEFDYNVEESSQLIPILEPS